MKRISKHLLLPIRLHINHQTRELSSTVLQQINGNDSMQMTGNVLFNRLKEDASKSNSVELSFKDMVEYSRASKLFASSSSITNDETHLIQSSEYVRKQLTVLMAQIVVDFQSLPYGVADNVRFQKVMQTYIDSYIAMKQISQITTIQHKAAFHNILHQYLASWTQVTVVSSLCLGLLEMAKETCIRIEQCPYLSHFIDRIITHRFAARILAGHYMALHEHKWGILEHNCDVMHHIESATADAIHIASKMYETQVMSLPKIKVYDERKRKRNDLTPFIFCGKMIHQFVFELIKNSIRATMEYHDGVCDGNDINVIVVSSNDGNITIKIADKAGGMMRDEMHKIWLYSYTQPRGEEMDEGYHVEKTQFELLENLIKIDKYGVTETPCYVGAILHENMPMYGFGYGLPLIRTYSTYFGGSCRIQSIGGYGTDAYLFLPTLATSKSNVLANMY